MSDLVEKTLDRFPHNKAHIQTREADDNKDADQTGLLCLPNAFLLAYELRHEETCLR